MQGSKPAEPLRLKLARVSATRETNEADQFVGERIRLYRSMLGMSQQKLADQIGVTFQQLQKYERGENRIGASRLLMVASALAIPITFLLDEEAFAHRHHGGALPNPDIENMLKDAHIIGRAFSQIDDPEIRKSITVLVQSLAQNASSAEE